MSGVKLFNTLVDVLDESKVPPEEMVHAVANLAAQVLQIAGICGATINTPPNWSMRLQLFNQSPPTKPEMVTAILKMCEDVGLSVDDSIEVITACAGGLMLANRKCDYAFVGPVATTKIKVLMNDNPAHTKH